MNEGMDEWEWIAICCVVNYNARDQMIYLSILVCSFSWLLLY